MLHIRVKPAYFILLCLCLVAQSPAIAAERKVQPGNPIVFALSKAQKKLLLGDSIGCYFAAKQERKILTRIKRGDLRDKNFTLQPLTLSNLRYQLKLARQAYSRSSTSLRRAQLRLVSYQIELLARCNSWEGPNPPTPTAIPVATPTSAPTATATSTPAGIGAVADLDNTPLATATATRTRTATPSPTASRTATPSATASRTATPTRTATATATRTPTSTPTRTATPTSTASRTPTITPTPGTGGPSSVPGIVPLTSQCQDGEDNDLDGLVDLADGGCTNGADKYEDDSVGPDGFTQFTPSANTQIIYVSNSQGNDNWSGLSQSQPKKSIQAGINAARYGFPDWVLLKAGDVWDTTSTISVNARGISNSEMFRIGRYGTGARPLIRAGFGPSGFPVGGFFMNGGNDRYIAINGIEIVGAAWNGANGDPSESISDPVGIVALDANDMLIEDVAIHNLKMGIVFHALVPEGNTVLQSLKLRRNSIFNHYKVGESSRAAGAYIGNTNGVLIEENFFDQNGYNFAAGSYSTIFQRNLYLQNDNQNVQQRANIHARSGSEIQQRSGGIAHNNTFLNNMGYGLAFNRGSPGLPQPILPEAIRYNVTIDSQNIAIYPNSSSFPERGVGLHLLTDNVLVYSNILKDRTSACNSNGHVSAIEVSQNASNNIIFNNKIYNWWHPSVPFAKAIWLQNGTLNNLVVNNEIQMPNGGLVVQYSPSAAATFYGNRYFSALSTPFDGPQGFINYSSWLGLSGEQNSTNTPISYPAPNRNAATYMAHLAALGLTTQPQTLEGFLLELRQQRQGNWKPELTADAFNNYIRQGFGW